MKFQLTKEATARAELNQKILDKGDFTYGAGYALYAGPVELGGAVRT